MLESDSNLIIVVDKLVTDVKENVESVTKVLKDPVTLTAGGLAGVIVGSIVGTGCLCCCLLVCLGCCCANSYKKKKRQKSAPVKPANLSAAKAKNSNSVLAAEHVDDVENQKGVALSSPDKGKYETSKMQLLNDKEDEEDDVPVAKIEQASE